MAGLANRIVADSAGITDYHTGEPPDPRAQAAAKRRSYNLSKLRARPVVPADFEKFDQLLAMDLTQVAWLRRYSPPEHHEKIGLFLDFAPRLSRREVPDPYYGAINGFELVLDLIEEASRGLLDQLSAGFDGTSRPLARHPG